MSVSEEAILKYKQREYRRLCEFYCFRLDTLILRKSMTFKRFIKELYGDCFSQQYGYVMHGLRGNNPEVLQLLEGEGWVVDQVADIITYEGDVKVRLSSCNRSVAMADIAMDILESHDSISLSNLVKESELFKAYPNELYLQLMADESDLKRKLKSNGFEVKVNQTKIRQTVLIQKEGN